jgi:uncharacterized tellurite resistance protein B-like protein
MSRLQDLKARVLADGVIDEAEVKELRTELYADGKIDRDEANLLFEIRNQAKKTCASFDKLCFDAVKENVLTDGSIDADEAAWLRKMLFADGKIDAQEKQFLSELRAQAKQVSPEFQKLVDECQKA